MQFSTSVPGGAEAKYQIPPTMRGPSDAIGSFRAGLLEWHCHCGVRIPRVLKDDRTLPLMSDEQTRLLIIDDDIEIRSVLQEFLGGSYQCVAVDSAESALAMLTTQPFDLIMSDIAMAEMSGLEMVSHIMKIEPQSVIIMISGQRTIESAIDAMRAGALDYITKPFDLAEVASAVRRALNHSRKKELHGKSSQLENELRRAIKEDEFVVHYQPKVAIESGRVVGFEALVRWNHPRLGLISPADFMTEVEETGLVKELGASVLRMACDQAREWHEEGFTHLHVAVNVSAKQVQDDDFFSRVSHILNDIGFDPTKLHLELTETSLMDDSGETVNMLTKLREIGLKIAIDDFGTGYSSLSYLKRLPIDYLKLDRSFVAGATTYPEDAALVIASIALAHNLGLKVVAEGVETDAQYAFLGLLLCDEAQGYLFGRPMPPELLRPMLDAEGLGAARRAEARDMAEQLILPISSHRSTALPR
ncbi:MAG TPA: EAL domain-containing protein [Pyrinomonadaceae bacterium]|nr:EAL domain-containing protein [Pyrinomonadaceae bacterium]